MTRSVRAALTDATATLAAAGVDSAPADAQWLLAEVLGCDRGRLLLVDDLDDEAVGAFDALVARRAQRVPLQHLLGSASFGPVELAVGPGVFVPRPETELLYAWAVRAAGGYLGGSPARTIVDLCTGSGALAIALALGVPGAQVHAVEISPDAAQWARRNVESAGVADRVHIHIGDATDPSMLARVLDDPADVVVSNPPYVPLDTPVEPEVAADPEIAVFGGADGMLVITPLIQVIAGIVAPGGAVGIEHDDSTAAAVVAVLEATGMFDRPTPHADLAGRPRFVTARRSPGRGSTLADADAR